LNRPPIVCLCGSTRFIKQFQEANLQETLKGNIVLSVGAFMHSDAELELTHEQKAMLDELHLRKIDVADEILVLNVNDYFGASTKREVWYAKNQGKRIRLWEYPSKVTTDTIRGWFVSWDDWLRSAKEAATTIPGSSDR
jgi:hypothetical protein